MISLSKQIDRIDQLILHSHEYMIIPPPIGVSEDDWIDIVEYETNLFLAQRLINNDFPTKEGLQLHLSSIYQKLKED